MGWEETRLEPRLAEMIGRIYKVPTPVQMETIPVFLAKRDLVVMARTGSGKTAAFMLPIIQMLGGHSSLTGCRALVLSPTRDLALQSSRFFKKYAGGTNLRCCVLIGGQRIDDQFSALSENPDLIVASPGRLLEVIAEVPAMSLSKVQVLVIDECDQMFELGLVHHVDAILRLLPERQTALFSATVPPTLSDFAAANLREAIVIRTDTPVVPDALAMEFRLVAPAFKPALLVRGVGEGSAIVFVATRHHAEFLAALLGALGINAAPMYGQMEQDERASTLARFGRGVVKVICVTDVAARGLDFEHVDLVINYDFPARPKMLLHRSGRTGRAGRTGRVLSFVVPDELPYFAGASDSLKGAWPISRVSRAEVEAELVLVEDAVKRSTDLQCLRRGMEDGERMYVRSRPHAKPLWLTLAKTLQIEGGVSGVEEELLRWRPHAQREEVVVPRPSYRREAVAAPEVPKSRFFINPLQDGYSATEGVGSLRDDVAGILPDERASQELQRRSVRFGKKWSKRKVMEEVVAGHRDLVRAAVARLEGVKASGEKYRAWRQMTSRRIQGAGQVEVVPPKVKSSGKPWAGAQRELKTAGDLQRERLAKEKEGHRFGGKRHGSRPNSGRRGG